MGGGGGGASNTVNENPLPDWAQPYVQSYLSRSDAISKASYTAYPGATYAPRNQDEIDGILALADRASNGSSTTNLGITLLVSTLKGEKLSGYPQKDTEWGVRADEVYDDFIYSILPKIDTNANMAGGFGGSGHAKMKIAAARKLFNDLAGHAHKIYGEDYFSERKYMNDAIGYAGEYAKASIEDIDQLRQAGLYEREYQQGILEDAFRLWLDEQESSIRRLDVMGNAIRAMAGSSVEKTTPFYRPGKMASIAGIALAGLSTIGSIYGKPGGAAAGGADAPSNAEIQTASGD